MTLGELKAQLGDSEHGNFFIKDTIGVPHPYCIGAKHVAHAADHHGGMLSQSAIESGERKGIVCEICKGKLTYAQHEQAILIGCRKDPNEGNEFEAELRAYLLKLNDVIEPLKKWAGYAFVREH